MIYGVEGAGEGGREGGRARTLLLTYGKRGRNRSNKRLGGIKWKAASLHGWRHTGRDGRGNMPAAWRRDAGTREQCSACSARGEVKG